LALLKRKEGSQDFLVQRSSSQLPYKILLEFILELVLDLEAFLAVVWETGFALEFLVSPAVPLLHAGEQGNQLDGEWSS
jgi:hypothetical protein